MALTDKQRRFVDESAIGGRRDFIVLRPAYDQYSSIHESEGVCPAATASL